MNTGEANAPAVSTAGAVEPPAQTIEPGTMVANRYRVASWLGEGAMGAVYRVDDVQSKKPFALKVLHAAMSNQREAVARFEREAIAAGKIGHPNVAAATDFGRMPDGSFFIILEFVAGKSLRSVLDLGALDPRRAIRIMQGVVTGVGAAHAKGIVHRDLKPENIMLVEENGDPDFVKVLDFGIAKVSDVRSAGHGNVAQTLTKAGTVIGTPDYMSPEQALGRAVDARSDLYSLGVVLYELLTGSAPFQGGAATLLRQQVMDAPQPLPAHLVEADPVIVELLGKLLAKKPEERYQTAAEVMTVLDSISSTLASKGVLHDFGLRGPGGASRLLRRIVRHLPRASIARLTGRRVALAMLGLVALVAAATYFAVRKENSASKDASSVDISEARPAEVPPSPARVQSAPPSVAATGMSAIVTATPSAAPPAAAQNASPSPPPRTAPVRNAPAHEPQRRRSKGK
jgi:serine/threonine-protein kinase